MECSLFVPFRLVGGTNLALRFGHRISTDIDLFTDYEYGSIDFDPIEEWLKNTFPYYDCTDRGQEVVMGRTYYLGNSRREAVKVDLMYEGDFFKRGRAR